MQWLVPAGLVGVVVGGVAYLRKMTLTVKPGDYVAVNPTVLAPSTFGLPQDARVLVRVDAATPNGISGQIAGYVASGQVVLAPAGIPSPPIQSTAVTALYRGSPPKLVG